MGEFKDYRKESRGRWGTDEETGLTSEQIQLGCLLRIADASELMAKNHADLIRDRDYFKGETERLRERLQKYERMAASLRGVITRMKNKAARSAHTEG